MLLALWARTQSYTYSCIGTMHNCITRMGVALAQEVEWVGDPQLLPECRGVPEQDASP